MKRNNDIDIVNDRKIYLSPKTEAIKIGTIDLLAASEISEIRKIPRIDANTDEAYGKKRQCDELDSYNDDEVKEEF